MNVRAERHSMGYMSMDVPTVVLEINGKRIQVTEEGDGTFEIWTLPSDQLVVKPLTNNKICLDVQKGANK